jgi:aspartyl-tRNA(Asn)/glutamyl-tRNA(Gln) amidotransferase subunit A
MAGEDFSPLEPEALRGLRFGIAEGLPLDRLDGTVSAAFAAATARLDGAGVRVTREQLALFDDMSEVNAKGGISPPEACAIHRDRLRRRASDIDPNVLARIERGCAVSAADYVEMVRERGRLVRAMDARLAGLDALLMPTTSIVAPTIAEVADAKVFAARNAALLRNTAIINFFDLCAISLPIPPRAGALPVGLMLVGRDRTDKRLLRIADAVARLFAA